MTSIVSLPKKLRLSSPSILSSKDDTSHFSSSEELNAKQAEADCMKEIRDAFRKFGIRLPQEKLFRYACFYDFNSEEAIEAIREDNYNPYLRLKMKDLEEQFERDALFPVPSLKSRKGSEVIYVRPSRFGKNKDCKLGESLCYVMNDLSQTEEQCRIGVTVIADMQDISRDNFSKEHCTRLIEALQGHMVPTRVETFLIVSPPSWFGKVWKWMKPNMSKDFMKRVHLIKQDRLSEFLMDDYEMFLPDDFCLGFASSSEISEDYVDKKMVLEEDEQ